jgi:hypothetical protein
MHGPAAAALPPILALTSRPSYLNFAIIAAIAVIVYEIRALLRRLFSGSASPASRRPAKRAPLLTVNLEAVVDQHRRAAGSAAPAIVVNATVPRPSAERDPMVDAPPAYLRRETATPIEGARMPRPPTALVRNGNAARMERDSPVDSVTAADSAISRAHPGDARDIRVADGQPLVLRNMSRRDQGRLVAFARRLPAHARIALAVDLNNAAMLHRWVVAHEVADARTVVAYQEARLVGYASLRRGNAPWTRHVGEICIVVGATPQDEEIGDCLGRDMVAQALDVGLQKVTAKRSMIASPARSFRGWDSPPKRFSQII